MKSAPQRKETSNCSNFRQVHAFIPTTTTGRVTPSYSGGTDVLHRPLTCPCGGGCPVCTETIQAKLEVGPANDQYEQEADRIADKVMRMPQPRLQRTPP